MIYDITPVVSPRLAVWPGDTICSRELLCDMARGDNMTLSTLRATVHLGAHADAPSHYDVIGQTIEQRSLELYLGPCQVVHVSVNRSERLKLDQLKTEIRAPRVLFATGTFPDADSFNNDFAALSPDLIDQLAAKGLKLIGLDTPSVDLFESKDLPSHAACKRNNLAILEGVVLRDVPAGIYELVALPLKLEGFDASPVRAILRTMT